MVTNKIYIIYYILLICSIVLAQPKWFGKKSSEFPRSEYFIGDGVGIDYNEALINAQSEIASQIKVSIASQLEMSITEVSKGDISELNESFNSEVKTNVDETVKGIVVVKKADKKLLQLNFYN